MSKRKLTGEELIDYCIENAGADETTLMDGAGYSTVRKGKLALKKTDFYHAVAAAKGIHIAPNRIEKPKTPPSFRVKASKRGVLPIAACYSSLIGIRPDEIARIETEGEGNEAVLVISREPMPVQLDDTAPISCAV